LGVKGFREPVATFADARDQRRTSGRSSRGLGTLEGAVSGKVGGVIADVAVAATLATTSRTVLGELGLDFLGD